MGRKPWLNLRGLTTYENAGAMIRSIVLTCISIVAVALRFVATRRSGRGCHIEDWLALTSLLFYLAFGVVNLVGRQPHSPASSAVLLTNLVVPFQMLRLLAVEMHSSYSTHRMTSPACAR